jgi:hypothetical protein
MSDAKRPSRQAGAALVARPVLTPQAAGEALIEAVRFAFYGCQLLPPAIAQAVRDYEKAVSLDEDME